MVATPILVTTQMLAIKKNAEETKGKPSPIVAQLHFNLYLRPLCNSGGYVLLSIWSTRLSTLWVVKSACWCDCKCFRQSLKYPQIKIIRPFKRGRTLTVDLLGWDLTHFLLVLIVWTICSLLIFVLIENKCRKSLNTSVSFANSSLLPLSSRPNTLLGLPLITNVLTNRFL